jgi:hypothetical protein
LSPPVASDRVAAGMFAHRTRQPAKLKGSRLAAAAREAEARQMLDHFADRLADHGDVKRAAAALGRSEAWGKLRLRDLRRSLGWQAE